MVSDNIALEQARDNMAAAFERVAGEKTQVEKERDDMRHHLDTVLAANKTLSQDVERAEKELAKLQENYHAGFENWLAVTKERDNLAKKLQDSEYGRQELLDNVRAAAKMFATNCWIEVPLCGKCSCQNWPGARPEVPHGIP